MNSFYIIYIVVISCFVANGQSVLYIGSPRTVYDSTYNSIPFYLPKGQTMRYQEVHSSGDFSSYGIYSSGGWIERLYFNGRGNIFYASAPTINGVEIRMSTTLTTATSLDPVFSSNIGLNETIVFSGQLNWYEEPVPPNIPSIYKGPSIVLQQPFFYRPKDGNLLIDIRVQEGMLESEPYLLRTVVSRPGNQIGGAYALNANSSQTDGMLSEGYAVLFQVNSIPEPKVYLILVIGILSICLLRRY